MAVEVKTMVGPEVVDYRDALARLRIAIFRDFPYLYDGTFEYEREYLQTYLDCPECLFVLVFDGDAVVGASTALPIENETAEFAQPFQQAGYDIRKVFYFGESVLKPAYRGQGLGHRFFDEREQYARTLGRFDLTTFCAVERPTDHAKRPQDYTPLDGFWEKRGYTKRSELTTTFDWKEVGEDEESPKPMTFWTRPLE
ncbi:MAG: GNAT family N-acetyltransferase [Verrucomicrobiota bacterium]